LRHQHLTGVRLSSRKAEIESQLVSEKRLRDLKIQIIDVSPQKDYDFAEFFYHVKQGILILTFDEKDDFKQIPDLTVLHPKDIKIQA
jgi:hypothetical protein